MSDDTTTMDDGVSEDLASIKCLFCGKEMGYVLINIVLLVQTIKLRDTDYGSFRYRGGKHVYYHKVCDE